VNPRLGHDRCASMTAKGVRPHMKSPWLRRRVLECWSQPWNWALRSARRAKCWRWKAGRENSCRRSLGSVHRPGCGWATWAGCDGGRCCGPKVAGEGATGELRAVIGQHPAELDPDAGQPPRRRGWRSRRRPEPMVTGHQRANGIAGGGVDRGQRPDRPDALGACRQRRCPGRPGHRGGRRRAEPERPILWLPWSGSRWRLR
jgi:hypothetical protein